MKRAEKKRLFLLIAVTLAVVAFYLLLQGNYLFASDVDWIAQHSAFPDYFRKLFYQTTELYPDFAIQIGGGQNIFNFGYYGLLNPCILLSYFFPFIKMNQWIIGVSLLSLVASVCLFYFWLINKNFDQEISFWTSLIFMLAGPLIYHSYVQIMFVNYMPFLLLALIATDRYFAQGRRGMLITGALLMILTSFYFSIGGLVCLCVYALYCFLKRNQSYRFKDIFFAAAKYLAILLHSVLLSGFYLLPVAVALLRGRSENSGAKLPLISSFFNPFSGLGRFFYEPYGLGLSMLFFIAMFAGCFSKKTAEKVLSLLMIAVTGVPLFTYLLNGGLYDSPKALIPFLPLACLLIGQFADQLAKGQITKTALLISALLVPALFLLFEKSMYWLVYFVDWILCLIGVFSVAGIFRFKASFNKKNKYGARIWRGQLEETEIFLNHQKKRNKMLLMQVVFVLLVSGSVINKKADMALDAADLQAQQEIAELAKQTIEMDNSSYRMDFYAGKRQNFQNINRVFTYDQKITSVYSSSYNRAYKNFRENIVKVEKPNRNALMLGAVENNIFRNMMGVKYIISDRPQVGYEKVISGQAFDVYQNESAAPLVYGTTRILAKEEYDQLKFPYNQLAFALYAIADNHVKAPNFDEVLKNLDHDITRVDSIKNIEGMPQGKYNLEFTAPKQDSLLLVKFHVDNLTDNRDLKIDFGTARNKLSAQNYNYYNENTEFVYVLEIKAKQSQLPLTFYDGNYRISEAEAYLAAQSAQSPLYEYEWKDDQHLKTRTSDVLSGSVKMEEAGYLITSIPFDNFSVTVNGQNTEAIQVNAGFLGVQLQKGENAVCVRYHAPGKRAGALLSLAGIVLLMLPKIFFYRKGHLKEAWDNQA